LAANQIQGRQSVQRVAPIGILQLNEKRSNSGLLCIEFVDQVCPFQTGENDLPSEKFQNLAFVSWSGLEGHWSELVATGLKLQRKTNGPLSERALGSGCADELLVWPGRLGNPIPVLTLLAGLILASQPAFAVAQAAADNQDRSHDLIVGSIGPASCVIFLFMPFDCQPPHKYFNEACLNWFCCHRNEVKSRDLD
jgi:hypothetical protein